MNQTIRTFALIAAGLLAAVLFLFALALALGMALLGVVALFAAWAASPEDTKAFLKSARGLADGWVSAMVKMVEDAGNLMREVLGRFEGVAGNPQAETGSGAPEKPEVSPAAAVERLRTKGPSAEDAEDAAGK